MIEFHHNMKLALLTLDTGAEINVISQQRLLEIFPEQDICQNDLVSTTSNLKTADGNKLECRGRIMLTVIIGDNQANLSFYLINSGNVLLVGVEGICQLNLIINIP